MASHVTHSSSLLFRLPVPPSRIPQYHQQMVAVLEWRRDVEQWRGGVDKRLENLETVTSTILERLGPQTLTPGHQSLVQFYVNQLHEATGKTHAYIQSNLRLAFGVPSYGTPT